MNHLQNIKTFISVVRLGSFAAAARKENVANSVISKRISQLEHHLGIGLLNRTTRSIHLTDLGNSYYQNCVEVASLLDSAEKQVRNEFADPYGQLRIYCGTSYSAYGFAADLAAFQELYPNIRLEVIHGNRAATPEHEEYDVCILVQPLASKNIVRQKISSWSPVTVASAAYVEEHALPDKPQDLVNHKCIFDSAFYEADCWHFNRGRTEISVALQPHLIVNSVPLMVSAVRNDMGIAIVPRISVIDEISAGSMVQVLPEYKTRSFDLAAYYTKASYVPQKVSLFVDFLVERHKNSHF